MDRLGSKNVLLNPRKLTQHDLSQKRPVRRQKPARKIIDAYAGAGLRHLVVNEHLNIRLAHSWLSVLALTVAS
jgi:hypothetical protein